MTLQNNLKYLSLILLLLGNASLSAKSPIKSPVFTDYGPIFKVDDLDVPVNKNLTYKALFNVHQAADTPDQLNRRIESIARFINMHAINGVPVDQMKLAVVLHGSATRDGLTHEAYEARHLVNNPTLDLITKLKAKGVRFYQCGQSAYFNGYDKSEFAKPVELALSAMTMFTQLQSEGYQLIP